MRKDLLGELAKDGINPETLTDKEVVEQVSRWFYARSKYRNMFCTNFVYFPGGKPAVYPGLEQAFEREKGDKLWSAASNSLTNCWAKRCSITDIAVPVPRRPGLRRPYSAPWVSRRGSFSRFLWPTLQTRSRELWPTKG